MKLVDTYTSPSVLVVRPEGKLLCRRGPTRNNNIEVRYKEVDCINLAQDMKCGISGPCLKPFPSQDQRLTILLAVIDLNTVA
jgi:hypothetical protein